MQFNKQPTICLAVAAAIVLIANCPGSSAGTLNLDDLCEKAAPHNFVSQKVSEFKTMAKDDAIKLADKAVLKYVNGWTGMSFASFGSNEHVRNLPATTVTIAEAPIEVNIACTKDPPSVGKITACTFKPVGATTKQLFFDKTRKITVNTKAHCAQCHEKADPTVEPRGNKACAYEAD